MSKKLENLEKDLQQLKQRQQQKSQEMRKERDRVTHRRRLVLGKFMEQIMERDKSEEKKILRGLNRDLVREEDRQLFDLPVTNLNGYTTVQNTILEPTNPREISRARRQLIESVCGGTRLYPVNAWQDANKPDGQ
ncbi:hypothetical protein HC341_07100 [Aquisalimonas sp. 2447]|uniref:hypothetical protein n=1 Tax=Aquisalimonas sp. 2447 TaxID=2740807 RepID=UPI0014324395|nr:hypothetical protein [Aquisalimonas sp. 2447]QIT55002.1 hypothetical protein HC341_07100 [Aquisalimonas sp. 2447]